MTTETVNTLLFAFVALAAIQAVSIYCVVRLVLTGKTLFERKPEDRRLVGWERS